MGREAEFLNNEGFPAPKASRGTSVALFALILLATIGLLILGKEQGRRSLDNVVALEAGKLRVMEMMTEEYAGGVYRSMLLMGRELEQRFRSTDPVIDPMSTGELNKQLSQWLDVFSNYDQLRVIGPNGRELSRVNYRDNLVFVVPTPRLQDKSHRLYVQRGLAAPIGKPIRGKTSLNEEFGQIDHRSLAVFRILYPLATPKGERFILAGNYLVDPLIQLFRSEAALTRGQQLMVARPDGILMYAEGDLAGNEYSDQRPGPEQGLNDLLPELWTSIIETNGEGYFLTADGAFVFRKLSNGGVIDSLPGAYGRDRPLPWPVAVIQVPNEVIAASNIFTHPLTLAFTAIAYLLLIGLALALWHQSRLKEALQQQTESQRHALGVMTYELLTPASAVEMLTEKGPDPEHWHDLVSASRQLLSVLLDLRTAIWPGARIDDDSGRVNLHRLMTEVESQLAPLLASRSRQLLVTHGNWDKPVYEVQVTSLRIALTSLIRHAAYDEQTGRIAFSVTRRGTSSAGDDIEFRIVGHPGSEQSDHLKTYTSIDTPEYQFGPFVGVSLQRIHNWAKDWGGELIAERCQDGTAQFTLRIQLREPRNPPTAIHSRAPEDALLKAVSRRRVLLAEDDELLRRLTCSLLEEEFDLDVTAAANGIDALQALGTHTFDLIITDSVMPGMDGVELIEVIREADAATPVILLTSASIVGQRQDPRLLGADTVLPKPLSREKLMAALKALHGTHRLTSVVKKSDRPRFNAV